MAGRKYLEVAKNGPYSVRSASAPRADQRRDEPNDHRERIGNPADSVRNNRFADRFVAHTIRKRMAAGKMVEHHIIRGCGHRERKSV